MKIQDVTDLFGFDIKITWDNTLITFASLDKTPLSTIWPNGHYEPLPAPGYQTGAGYLRYAAVAEGAGNGFSGSGTLFNITFNIVKACNFPLSTPIGFDTVELSDSQASSIPSTNIGATYSMAATVPDLEFDLVNPNTTKPWEYCKYFEVQVYVTDICAHLTDYDLEVNYDLELLEFVDVDAWGVFGTGHVDSSTAGIVHVWCDPSTTPYVGDKGLLFTLTFHVRFDDRIEHIWRISSAHTLDAHISLDTTYGDLSFEEGTILISAVTTPSPLTVLINLIKGDVNCDGHVNILDLGTIAYYYDQNVPSPAPAKYDLKTDDKNIIDIYDLVVVATNFNYYNPDTPPMT
jgi:hypothetical protein